MEKGRISGARQHFERAVGLVKQTQDSIVASPISPWLPQLRWLSDSVCWVLGYPDPARVWDRLAQLLKQSFPVFAHAIGSTIC